MSERFLSLLGQLVVFIKQHRAPRVQLADVSGRHVLAVDIKDFQKIGTDAFKADGAQFGHLIFGF